MMIFLYGPPGSGKSALGLRLADRLKLPFTDLDREIEARAGCSIPEIFASSGETGFRTLEAATLGEVTQGREAVVALGGGALLDETNRARVESIGCVLCLGAPVQTLLSRLQRSTEARPLLTGTAEDPSTAGQMLPRLESLLARRAAHYASFSLQLDTSGLDLEETVKKAQIRLGRFRVAGMGSEYDVLALSGGLQQVGQMLADRGLLGPVALVSDENVAPHYALATSESLEAASFTTRCTTLPAGERHKTVATVTTLWQSFLDAGLERSSTVVALGGGVVGDLAGFAAATYLRGVNWVVLPTTLLAMVDSSLGGKTGADLPQGKNLVGAFFPPRLVLADPITLRTLPDEELRSGLAEVVKHAVIGDPALFQLCARGLESIRGDLDEIVRRAMAVKIAVIEEDPYERGRRAALNLGHTLGHALESASAFRLRHGEAVAIGMVAAARLAERLSLADAGLVERIQTVLMNLGLPTESPEALDPAKVMDAMNLDKKRKSGKPLFALPIRIGEVQTGIEIPDHLLRELL